MPQSFDTLRVGHFYKLINYGEENEFEVLAIKENEIRVKDLNSLEVFPLHLLIEYGKGSDYDLYEMEA